MKISSAAIQGALRNKIDSLKMSVRYYLILPVEHPVQYNRLTDCALNLVEAARNQAQGFAGKSNESGVTSCIVNKMVAWYS